MIDEVINNGRKGEEIESAKEGTEKRPSIRERLENAKKECAKHKPPEPKCPGRDTPEHGDLCAGVRNGGWNGPSFWVRMDAASTTRYARVVSTHASRVFGWFSLPVPITSPHARKK